MNDLDDDALDAARDSIFEWLEDYDPEIHSSGRVAEQVIRTYLSVLRIGNLEVLRAIEDELRHQEAKWGKDKPQSLPGFLLVLESELTEAKNGWMKNLDGRNSPLAEIVQVAAVAIACLCRYGTVGSARATNDVTEAEMREERARISERRFGAR